MARLVQPGSRVPAEPHLGAHDMYRSLSADSSASSHISPLALPRSLDVRGYFDHHLGVTSHPQLGLNSTSTATKFLPLGDVLNGSPSVNQTYAPISSGLRGPPQAQPLQFLSPHLTPTGHYPGRQRQPSTQRSASLSPTRQAANSYFGRVRTRSAMVSPSRGGGIGGYIPPGIQEEPAIAEMASLVNGSQSQTERISIFSTGQTRSEANSISHGSSPQMIDLLVKQNARLREAWEDERKYLQANRERAEEVYKEERALMEEERIAWLAERDLLVQEISTLRQNVISLGGGKLLAKSVIDGQQRSTSQALRGGGWSTGSANLENSEAALALMFGSGQSRPTGSQEHGPADGTKSLTKKPSLMSFGQPNDQHQSAPFTLPPQNSNAGESHGASPPLGGSSRDMPVPTVDVQEIHPDLEGIPIKATAIQQETFSDKHISPDASRLSSGKPSPPINADGTSEAPKRPSKEQTLQMLKTNVADRLIMHAGHTPNHSMSFLPTAIVSEVSTTIDSNGSTTPTIRGDGSGPEDADADDDELHMKKSNGKGKSVAIIEVDGAVPVDIIDEAPTDLEGNLNAPDDPPLKGPLMVRNMPAHDEIFFRRLSDKLEVISRGENAIPKALKGLIPIDEESNAAGPSAPTGGDGAAETAEKEGNAKSDDDAEIEIPLKLKRSNNFGAPLGEFR